jgi:hypothetical protein
MLTIVFSEQLEQDFPFWKRLHGFWRSLPNFNPYTASSEPGQDLAANALTLIHSRGQDNSNDEPGFQDDLSYCDEDTQNVANERAESAIQSNEKVRCQPHPCPK